MLKLSELKKGYTGIIKHINCDDSVKVRLMDMGFNKGEKISCILVSPSRTIKAYLIKNTLISLRDNIALDIEVGDCYEDCFDR